MRTRSNREYNLAPGPTFSKVRSGRIGKTWPKKKPAGPITRANERPKGLENPGCLCYRRAVLQCLLHTPVFYNYLCRLDGCTEEAAEQCVLCAFRDFAVQYWTSTDQKGRYAANNRLDAAIRGHPSRFEGVDVPDFVSQEDEQHDAHEFFMGLLLMLEHIDGLCLNGKFALAISNLFDMTVRESWKCKNCGEIHAQTPKYRGFGGLSIANASHALLEQHIGNYLAPETVDHLACDSAECDGSKDVRTREKAIVRGPEILVIQLSRFDWDFKKNRPIKSKRVVRYEQRLDLSHWTADESPLEYKLRGVVGHAGKEPSHGHYIAGLKCQNEREYAIANDSRIRCFDSDAPLLFESPLTKGFDACILVYQKVGGGRVNLIQA